MAGSTAVEKAKPAGVPALVQTPALDIDAGDVTLPRIKFGQPNSVAVQDGLVPAFGIYATNGPDDIQPDVLHELDKGEGLLIHVLGLRKGKSLSVDGELHTWAFSDPSAPQDAWVTYDYIVCCPEADPEVPYKFLFTRTGAPAAKQINTVLKKNEGRGPAYVTAFRVSTIKRENDKGRFAVPRVRVVDATDEGIQASAKLAGLVAGTSIESNATGDAPAI